MGYTREGDRYVLCSKRGHFVEVSSVSTLLSLIVDDFGNYLFHMSCKFYRLLSLPSTFMLIQSTIFNLPVPL